jgi:hypothetical protein
MLRPWPVATGTTTTAPTGQERRGSPPTARRRGADHAVEQPIYIRWEDRSRAGERERRGMKPAPAALEISQELVAMLDGLPVELVAGHRPAALAAMADPEVDAVTITGSSTAGFGAQEVCGRRRIPLQAELGATMPRSSGRTPISV